MCECVEQTLSEQEETESYVAQSRKMSLKDSNLESRMILQIEGILDTQPIDLDELHSISRMPGGFLTNDLRKRTWAKFLAINKYKKVDFRSLSQKPPQQLRVDIDRSFHNLEEHTRDWSEEKFAAKKVLLGDIMTAVLQRNPELHYYQGFHSVCVTCIEVCEDDPTLAFMIVEYLAKHYFRDYLAADFEVVTKFLPLVLEIIRKVDRKLFMFLSTANIEAFFATSWIITWLSHDIKKVDTTARIYDGLICSHPLFVMYMATALVLHVREEVMALPCLFANVHTFLVNINDTHTLPYEAIMRSADRLMSTLPPARLKALAVEDLKEKIRAKEVALFMRPPCITRYADTDALMLDQYLEDQDREEAQQRTAKETLIDHDLFSAVAGLLTGGWWA